MYWFFPKENLAEKSGKDGSEVRNRIGSLAKKFAVNLVAGSVSDLRNSRVFNTSMIFYRMGTCVAAYDKTHLFTLMGEDKYYTRGSRLCRFMPGGTKCGVIICNDSSVLICSSWFRSGLKNAFFICGH